MIGRFIMFMLQSLNSWVAVRGQALTKTTHDNEDRELQKEAVKLAWHFGNPKPPFTPFFGRHIQHAPPHGVG